MLGIIGGTGLYSLPNLEITGEHAVTTPFGPSSAPVVEARYGDKTVFFLPRHGRHHEYLPHEVNYRANLFALKTLGVRQVLGVSAVGSLREAIAPGHFAVASQYLDLVRGPRDKTFLGGGLSAHISTADPVCPAMAAWIAGGVRDLGHAVHDNVTYACVDGPRLGTRAESHMLRTLGADLVGMTNVPEVFLAREAQMAYATLAIVTDYDCWREGDETSVAAIMQRFGDSLGAAKAILSHLLDGPLPATDEGYRQALKGALMVNAENLAPDKQALLEVLLR